MSERVAPPHDLTTSPPHHAWQELVTAALVGGGHESPRLPGEGALGDLLSRLDVSSRERQLLGAAAALSLYRRAGTLPAADTRPLPEPCSEESISRCSPASGRHLAEMLSGTHDEVLPEWLGAAKTAGVRVPEDLLPALLDLGAKRHDYRDLLHPVLGERGRWLAAYNPDWGYVVGAAEEVDWETAPRDARLALLKRLRADDPGRARELLESTWVQEPHEERAAFLPLLEVGLSMEDEPFLEAALADKRKEVRTTAADLLARLPEARLSMRVLERVRPLLAFTPGQKPRLFSPASGRKPSLAVTLPKAHDKAMARDGIEAKPPHGMGQKAFWLLQMVGVVPPETWCRAWDVAPGTLLEAAAATEFHRELLAGWANAAARHRDAAWAEALLATSLEHTPDDAAGALLDALPPERREAVVLPYLQDAGGAGDRHPAVALLVRCRHAWSEAFTRAALRFVRDRIRLAANRQDWHLHSVLKGFAYHAAPSLAAEAGESLRPPEEGMWRNPVEQFVDLLHFRREMLAALRS